MDPETQENPNEERPDWLPDNFDSPESLVASYKEAERKISSQGQRLAELEQLEDRFEELASRLTETPQQQERFNPDEDPFIQAYDRAFEEGDSRTLMALNAYHTEAAIRSALESRQQYEATESQNDSEAEARMFAMLTEQAIKDNLGDEWSEELKREVGEVVYNRPHLIPDSRDPSVIAEAIVDVADLIRIRKARDTGEAVEPHSISRQRKMLAQSAQGEMSRVRTTPQQEADEWERIKKAGESSYGDLIRPRT